MMMMKTFLLDNQKPFPHIIILGDSDHHNRLRGIASERERERGVWLIRHRRYICLAIVWMIVVANYFDMKWKYCQYVYYV